MKSVSTKSKAQDCEQAHVLLDEYIEEQRLRKTPERHAILDVVTKMKGHHSADEILGLMPEDFHVSRTSVYNTLKLLENVGIVIGHQIDGTTLYEFAVGCVPHHHYVCRGCKRMWDMKDDMVTETAMKCKTPRFRKIRCSVYIYGLCDVCQARMNRLKKKLEKQKVETMTREERRFARIDEELAEASKWLNES